MYRELGVHYTTYPPLRLPSNLVCAHTIYSSANSKTYWIEFNFLFSSAMLWRFKDCRNRGCRRKHNFKTWTVWKFESSIALLEVDCKINWKLEFQENCFWQLCFAPGWSILECELILHNLVKVFILHNCTTSQFQIQTENCSSKRS